MISTIFGQVEAVQGWGFASTLALLGGAIWKGTFDFTLLRPVHTQLIASFQRWRPLALLDLLLGFGVLWPAGRELGHAMRLVQALAFILLLSVGVLVLYSVLLALASLIFWSPGFLHLDLRRHLPDGALSSRHLSRLDAAGADLDHPHRHHDYGAGQRFSRRGFVGDVGGEYGLCWGVVCGCVVSVWRGDSTQ